MNAYRAVATISLALLFFSHTLDALRISEVKPQRIADIPPLLLRSKRSEALAAEPSPTVNAQKDVVRAFDCPEPFGTFEDPYQCDKFWMCEDSVPQERLCEDGLVFDIRKVLAGFSCDSPFNVDCGDRLELQEPTMVNEYCPRLHGFFPPPDPTICDAFHTCIQGVNHGKTSCTFGLHYSPEQGICTWPADAKRKNCVEKVPTVDGFSCPTGEVKDPHGVVVPHPSYANKNDCRVFFTCLNGKTPQKSACPLGEVFDARTSTCEYPEDVPDCVGWYRDDPLFAHYYDYYDTNEPEADVGNQDTVV